jgi:16S rRNA (guanine527-N7)-methyltransferase
MFSGTPLRVTYEVLLSILFRECPGPTSELLCLIVANSGSTAKPQGSPAPRDIRLRTIYAALARGVSLDAAQIEVLLKPYLSEYALTANQLDQVSIYIDILIKWNERTNLTSIRNPDMIVQRHFGESFFAAVHLLASDSKITVADVGSGAGFPGLPLKIFAPELQLTLIEAHSKKNTFLREVVRAMNLEGIEVYLGRAESYGRTTDLVTMRAVEQFGTVLPVAAGLVAEGGRLALLVGSSQVVAAAEILPGAWSEPIAVPKSESRMLVVRTAK